MKDISLSINPTYLCNLRCDFCYLSKEQLSDKKVIAPSDLFARLSEISMFRKIEHVDIYGGEVSLIRPQLLEELMTIIKIFYPGKINVISNLTALSQVLLKPEVELSVSWDYFAREHFEKVYQNMLLLEKEFSVLILASEKLVRMTNVELDDFIEKLNALPLLKSVEIKPYSKNKANVQAVTFSEYEEWIVKWIRKSPLFKFRFVNIDKIEASLNKEYSSWSDDHLYITPEGKFAVLEFDENHNEYFKSLNDYSAYENWSDTEKKSVNDNAFCKSCGYLGHCLSEHLQSVQTLETSCNGFRNLLDWYEHERL